MSIAIAPAIKKVMKRHSLAMSDVDLWELHAEAYAVTTLYNQRQLQTPWDITNVNGGAIALGHPYGMSWLVSATSEARCSSSDGRRSGARWPASARQAVHGHGGVSRARLTTVSGDTPAHAWVQRPSRPGPRRAEGALASTLRSTFPAGP